MTKTRSSSKSGLFLIELIIAIVFFAISSAVCMQLFAKAHMISQTSRDLNTAVICAQNVAEAFCATNGAPQAFAALLETGGSGDVYAQYFDSEWNRSDEKQAKYELIAVISPGGNLMRANIAVNRIGLVVADSDSVFFASANRTEIYRLTAWSYPGEKEGTR